MAALSAAVSFPASSVGARHRARPRRRVTARAFVDQTEDDAAGPAKTSTATKPADASTPDAPADGSYVETDDEVRERTMVGQLVQWCVERGASGSGLSVRLPDGSGRGRGLEASRDIAEGEPVLSLPLEMGICDYQDGHPPDSWETMSNAPWGVRLACRLLQERSKSDDSEWAPYLALLPDVVPGSPLLWTDEEVLALQYPPAVAEAREMRDAVKTWHAKLEAACPSALAGADVDSFAAAVSVVHSRTYGVASAGGEGYFRALLPLADLLNHAGDEYDAASSKWPPARAGDNIAWSTLDDDGTIEFAATRAVEPGEEATMSYGERSNDHFLMYYGFTPPRNPHDDVVLFSDVEHALSWHMVYHPEMWDAGTEEEANTRESAARAAVREVERALAETSDGELAAAEPRFKVLPGGRCDARLVSLFAAAYAGTDEGVEGGKRVMDVDIESAHADVARRCAELLRQMPTTLRQDEESNDATPGFAAATAYRAHKKEVLVDVIVNLGKDVVRLPDGYE